MKRMSGKDKRALKKARVSFARALQNQLIEVMNESARKTYTGEVFWDNKQKGFFCIFKSYIINLIFSGNEIDFSIKSMKQNFTFSGSAKYHPIFKSVCMKILVAIWYQRMRLDVELWATRQLPKGDEK